jgi:hypothetical protein
VRFYDDGGALRGELPSGLEKIETLAWRPEHDSVIVGGMDLREVEFPPLESVRKQLSEHIAWSRAAASN